MVDFCGGLAVKVSAHVPYYIAERSFAVPFIFPHYNITHETNYVHLCVLPPLPIRGIARDALPCLPPVSAIKWLC
jgi:hypothetical protein